MRHHFLLEKAPDALPEEVVVLVENPPGSDVHQRLGGGGFQARGADGLPVLLRLSVLQSGGKREADTYDVTRDDGF